MDTSYGWILENLLIFTVSPDIGATCSITSDIIFVYFFQLKVPFGITLLQNIYFFKKNYPMISFENLDTPPRRAKFDQGVRYRLVLSFRCERMKHLKTNCFKHTYIDHRKTDTCC